MSNLLPTWRPPKPTITRPSAERVNDLQPQKQTITVAGYGEIVPLVYGRAEVAGPVIAGPIDKVNGTIVYYAIALSHGTINKVISAKVGSDEHTVNVTPTAAGATHTITGDGYTYECRFYNGAQTTHDAMLAGQLTNYKDVFTGVSYVRIKMSGVNASWGGIDFEIEGKKVFDPRSSTTVYSENPALHLNDFVSNPIWGLGRQVIGVERAANECDRILAYGPKARTGHTINVSASESGNLELLAMYAEVLFGFAGDAVIVVPDAAVDESEIIDIPIKQIWNGSVRPSSKSAENIPSSITITFNTKDTDGLAGSPAYVSIEQTSASDPVVNSALTLIGVYRREEAQRRANQRLAQLRTPGRISFQMFDSGIYFKAGDVVRMPDVMGLAGSEFRLVSDPTMVRAGVYQLDGEVYSIGVYSALSGTQIIPKDAVLFRLDDVTPTGMSKTASLGLIRGKSIGGIETTGDADVGLPAASTSKQGGDHSATIPFTGTPRPRLTSTGGTDSGRSVGPSPIHRHDIRLSGSIGGGLWRRANFRALVANEDLNNVPVGSYFLCANELPESPYFSKSVVMGLLSAANEASAKSINAIDDARSGAAGRHRHYDFQLRTVSFGGNVSYPYPIIQHLDDGGITGEHDHSLETISNKPELETRAVDSYITSTTASIIPTGGIVGFAGEGAVPQGWALCNGLGGTVDLTESFIDIGGEDKSGASDIPAITVSNIRLKESGEHDHKGVRGDPTYNDGTQTMADHPPEDGLHTHEIEWQSGNPFPITITPRYTKMRFIQYIGE